ncbi:MAG: ATP-dependent helicase [Christensenellales bacterium]|jgi:DNA helicase-2/ATP-dependent DNA helicase PcrA
MDLSKLNDRQREAVTTTEGPLLVLAGAGSGKTRVITYRIAYLIQQGVYPERILALTFTNKAAREMGERVEQLAGERGVWVSTFHSACARILRRDIDKIGYSNAFTIYDGADQGALVADCLQRLEIPSERLEKRQALALISEAKNRSENPTEYIAAKVRNSAELKGMDRVFELYSRRLFESSALDFDDLLLLTIRLFKEAPEVLEHYQNRFEYIHVDEYQDTNLAQYTLVKMLCKKHGNLCVVGDDDQGIYSWRGADIRNILEFEKDFPNTKIIRLEQNYRSTRYILSAANTVIQNNRCRKEKKLWTDREEGEKLTVYQAPYQHAEARFLCETIFSLRAKGYTYGDCAVLYRLNSQSRVIEETLRMYNIPYRVYGGLGFYQRKEIKDLIAYLRVLENPADDISLKRIINNPKRGIGDAAISALEGAATTRMQPLFSIVLDARRALGDIRSVKKIEEFAEIMTQLIAYKSMLPLGEFVERMVKETGYSAQYEKMNNEEGRGRLENIGEFIGAVHEFEESMDGSLADFLESVALVSDIDELEDESGAVSLMTMHSAKGLEFPVVFVTGLEEGIFPHARAFYNADELEEERRLCYVAITRAQKHLYLTYCTERNLFGKTSYNKPSRFLEELPEACVQGDLPQLRTGEGEPEKQGQQRRQEPKSFQKIFVPAAMKAKENAQAYQSGVKVFHKKFGNGVIETVEGEGAGATVTVDFEQAGVKRLSLSFAPLELRD